MICDKCKQETDNDYEIDKFTRHGRKVLLRLCHKCYDKEEKNESR